MPNIIWQNTKSNKRKEKKSGLKLNDAKTATEKVFFQFNQLLKQLVLYWSRWPSIRMNSIVRPFNTLSYQLVFELLIQSFLWLPLKLFIILNQQLFAYYTIIQYNKLILSYFYLYCVTIWIFYYFEKYCVWNLFAIKGHK